MTAKWESYLKTIGEGKGSPKAFLSNIEKFINKLITEVPGHIKSEAIAKSKMFKVPSDLFMSYL